MPTCEYCNKVIAKNSNMARHQKTKACLKAQQGDAQGDDKFQCNYCHRHLSSKFVLNQHTAICIPRLNSIIQIRDSEIAHLRDQVAELEFRLKIAKIETENEMLRSSEQHHKEVVQRIAEQPKTTNNTTNNLILPSIDTSQENVNRMVESNYTMNHFCCGQKGVARFAVDHLLIDANKQLGYVCTDPARGTFKHIGDEGEVVRDVKAARLTTKLATPIKRKAGKLASELADMDKGNEELMHVATRHFQDVSELAADNTGFRTELAGITVQ